MVNHIHRKDGSRNMALTIKWEKMNDDGETVIVEVPAEYVVCWDCEGEGKTLNENLRGAFTQEEFDRCFEDKDSKAEYKKGGQGIYGVTCKTCKGRTTILAPDTNTKLGKEYARHLEEVERENEADRRTMMMESGGY